MDQLQALGSVFKGVLDVADTPIHLFGYWIAPLDIWITTAIIYMLFDIFLTYMRGDVNDG